MTRFVRAFEIGDRAFGWVVLLAFIAFIAHKPAIQFYDDLFTSQPWFDVSFKVKHSPSGEDVVLYERKINRIVHGVWNVSLFSLESKTNPRLDLVCHGGGYATYRPVTSGTIELTLDEFVGTECRLSPGNYEMCAFYNLKDKRSVSRHFGPYCYRFKR